MLNEIKKILCMGLCLVALLSVFPLLAYATEGLETDGVFNYEFKDYQGTENDCYRVMSCLKNESEIAVPDSFNGYPVKEIEGDVFALCSNLRKVTIPETIEYLPQPFLLEFIYTDSKFYKGIDGFTIAGKPGTCSEEFARAHNVPFLSVDCEHTQKELFDKTDATCTEDGYTGDVWCTDCYAIYDAGETIPAIGGEHKISGWIIDKKATVDNIGYKHRVCTRCGMDMGDGYIPHVKPKKIKLASVSNSSSGVKITWNKDSNSDTYRVYRKTYSDGKWSGWKKIDEVKKTEYVDYDVTSGRKYKYTVCGCNINGNGSYDKTGLEIYYVSKTTLKSVSKAEKGYNISWKKRSGVTGYCVYRSVHSNGEWSEWTKIKTTKATSFNDTNTNSKKLYKYRVRTYKGSSYSSASNVLSTKSSALEPEITSIKNIENGVKVSWRKVNGAESYSIYCKEYSSWKKLATVSSTKSSYSYKFNDMGGTRYYCVKANCKGVQSTYTSKKFDVIPTPTVKLKATGSGINISWDFISPCVDKYYIYRKAPGETSWERIGKTVGYENRSYTDKNVKNNKKYTYTVRGVKGYTLGSYNKNGVSKKFMAAPKVTYKVGKNVVLNWSKVSGATKYRVYRRHDRTFKWELLKTTTGTSFTDKNIKYGVYAVKAVNDNNSSGLSDIYINTEKYVYRGYNFFYPTSESRREKMARKVAKEIASKCTKGNDRERVANAAEMVYDYYATCCYDSDYGSDVYNEAYGVFWGQLCTCAGTAAAMGMVLEEMGFDYTHVNKGKFDHQWCVLTMDGKKGWADGMVASANYGTLDTTQPDIYLTNVQKERYMKCAKEYIVQCAKELGMKVDQSITPYFEDYVWVEGGKSNFFGSPEGNIEYYIYCYLSDFKEQGADRVSYKFSYTKLDDGEYYMKMEFGFEYAPIELTSAEKKLCKQRLNYADEYIKCYGFQKNLIFEEVASASNRKSTAFSMLEGKSEKKYRAEVREFVKEAFSENKDAYAYSYSIEQGESYINIKIDFWDKEGYQELLEEKEIWGI